MPGDLKSQLEHTRDGYKAESTWLRFLIDAYTGGGGFQGKVRQPIAGFWGSAAEAYASLSVFSLMSGVHDEAANTTTYLDRYPREDDRKFARRRDVAHYLNYVKPTTNLKVSYLVRKPHVRNNMPKQVEEWIERTGYDDWFRRRAVVAAVLGWFPMLVDMPAIPNEAVNAQQAGEPDPYPVMQLPCQLLDFQLDDRDELVWAKLVHSYEKRASWDSDKVDVKRYAIWTRDDVTVYEVEKNSKSGTERVGDAQVTAHAFGRVPVVFWRADTSVEDPVKAESINADIALEARRLFNLLSELDEHVRSQVFALLVLPMILQSTPQGGKAEVGVENGLQIGPEQKNVPFYLAPPETVAATLESRISNTIVEIYRMARVEYTKAAGTNSSAQSKEQEFEQTNLAIADFGASLAAADLETLRIVAKGLKVSDEEIERMECVAHQSYASDQINNEIDAITSVLTISALGSTFRSELLKRFAQKMLPSLNADTRKIIESEIDKALVEEAQAKEAGENEPPDTGDAPGDDQEDDVEDGDAEKPGNRKGRVMSFTVKKDSEGGITVEES
jgi:hypothetical protein